MTRASHVARAPLRAQVLVACQLRPKAPVARFDDLGHYPQIEDPDRVVEALQRAFSA